MRVPISCLSLSPILFLVPASAVALGADRATVQVERAPVYAEPRASDDKIVKTLLRGDAVEIVFSISSTDGDWCEVSGTNYHLSLGYMRCGALKLPARSEPSATYIAVPTGSAAPLGKTSAAPPPRAAVPPVRATLATKAGLNYIRPLRFWAERFNFKPEQMAALDDLADRGGVTDCRREWETYTEKYESTPPPFEKSEFDRRFAAAKIALNRFWYTCDVKLQNVVERLPELMTAEQRANTELFAEFQREIAGRRRVLESPNVYKGIR